MSKKKAIRPNPQVVTPELCEAYRGALAEKIKSLDDKISGLRNTIIVGLTIATLIITTVLTVVQYYLAMAKP